MTLFIATSNEGKFREMSEVFARLSVELQSLATLGITDQVEEDGSSYKDNARIKASYFHNRTGLPTLGEDSGIVVDALAGQLGMHTRRWGAGADASDEEWLDHFMRVMEEHQEPEQRTAKFISHMCFMDGEEEIHVVGQTHGLITHEVEAPLYSGLPLSSVFKPIGQTKVYSALSEDEKNEVSHRGKAGRKMCEYLKQYFA